MCTFLSEKITNYLIRKNVIENDNREIYKYGLKQVLTTILNLITVLLLGVIFREIFQSIFLTIAFMALRTYSGGYHASTPIRCYILTTMSITVSLSIMKFVAINNFIYLGLSILSSLVILLISPIGTPNKPLDEIEINIYRKKTIIVWCVEISVALMSFVLNVTEIHTSIVFAQVLISIALVFGKVQYH